MMYTVQEIMQFVQENDVKFSRLSFCDEAGRLKNMSVMPDNLQRVFGQGQEFDASPIFAGQERLRLMPDPSTLMAMPWRPSQGRVVRFFCDVLKLDGTHFERDYRYNLKQAHGGSPLDLQCKCSFFLFRTDESGSSTSVPWDTGGYLDVSPFDKGENIRRELCLSLDEMKIPVLASYHGEHCGQNVVVFKAASLLEAADFIVAFKFAAQSIAVRNGLTAEFTSVDKQAAVFRVSSSSPHLFVEFTADKNPYIETKGVL